MEKMAKNERVWQSPRVIALVALALRLFAIGFLYRNVWNNFENHLLFGYEIGRISRSIAAGHGFGNPMFVETGPTAWTTPVYPYLLAGVFKLFGVYSRTSAFVILGLNSIFSALVCVPLFFIARRSFGPNVAVGACWIWALWPYSIYLASGFVWETCLSALLLAILFLWMLKLREVRGTWDWLGFGVLWGFSGMTNASILVLFPFLTGWSIYPLWRNRRDWLKPAALATFGLGMALLPWQVRNFRVFHKPIPLRDNFWLEVWVGNDGRTDSWLDVRAHPSTNEEELADFVRLGEVPYMQEKRRQALDFLGQHPGLYLVLCARRFAYMWTGFWNLDAQNLAVEFHSPANVFLIVALTAMMLLGLGQALRSARESVFPYLLVLLMYPLLFCLTHPQIRYRHLIDPEIVILAGLGVRSLVLGDSQRNRSIPEVTT